MPTFSEMYPIVFLLIAFLTTGFLIMNRYPLIDDDQARDIQIDGLRGLLAFGVMTFHYFAIHRLVFIGEFKSGMTSSITSLLGVWTVPIFFAITAYLFSQRLTKSEHHGGSSTIKFLLGRVFRLAPTSFLACLLFLLANIDVYTDIRDSNVLLHNWTVLMNAALSSLAQPALGPNSDKISSWAWDIACNPQWTLHYEWLFYLTLAALSIFTLKKLTTPRKCVQLS
jgi:peptidoglycan/LPS O-acetylase OafA/YrhL